MHGLTLIAFIGSVFSPYYAFARAQGRGDPANHIALNVALYGPRARWAMTERGRSALVRDAASLAIGPSRLTWDGTALSFDLAETTAPIPSPVRGRVRVIPPALTRQDFALDQAGLHRWQPLSPKVHVEVALDRPALSWSGPGYLDTNHGARPLERDFRRWDWSRAHLRDGSAILYESARRDGSTGGIAIRIDRTGDIDDFEPPGATPLPRTRWRLARQTRAEASPRIVRRLEDAPFYARSLIATRLLGEDATAMHESLDLDRLVWPATRFMLPFRMPHAMGRIWG